MQIIDVPCMLLDSIGERRERAHGFKGSENFERNATNSCVI
jgi:hypothetical protein